MQQRASFSGAYAVAAEAKSMFDGGMANQAEEMLTEFMQETVNQMLETVDELNAEFAVETVSAD